jgi:hypothetical protein
VNRVVKIIAGVKVLIVVASAVALILESLIYGETRKIERDTDSLVMIETQIKDLLELAKPKPSSSPEVK